MSNSPISTQVYCEKCKSTIWFETSGEEVYQSSGIRKKSLIHNDHVLICEIDNNGTVRKTEAINIEFNPMSMLIEDVSQGFHFLNDDLKRPVVINCYTSNTLFKKFIQSIIMKMFEQATTNRIEDKYKFTTTTFEKRTTLQSNMIYLSVGPYTKLDYHAFETPIRGIILDMNEAEYHKIDIEDTLNKYDWAAIIVQKEKQEGYFYAFSSLFKEIGQPFFIEVLSNDSIKELFDFIFTVILSHEMSIDTPVITQ